MEVPELNFDECASVFVRDDFYESIRAPKFHDFCSFEEEPGDVDAFFGKSGGTMTKKPPRQLEGTCVEHKVVKVKNVVTDIIFPQNVDIPGCRTSSPALIPDEYSTVEKASVCGSKNVRPPTAQTKSLDKVPPKSKSSKRPNIPRTVPIPCKASDRSSSDNSHQPSATEFHCLSENEDPNAVIGASRNGAIKAASKSVPQQPMSASVYAASQCLFERKETSESMVLDAQILGTKSPSAAAGMDDSIAKQPLPTSAVRLESSQVKGRKRKSSGRSADGSVYKSLESHPSFRSSNWKASRKGVVEAEACSKSSEALAVSENKPANPFSGTVATCASFSYTSAHTKKSPASWKTRRISDQSRRRRLSIGAKTRSKSKISGAPSAMRKERTRTLASESASTVSSQASCPNRGSISDGRTRNAGHERDACTLQTSRKKPLLVSTGDTSASCVLTQVSQTVTVNCRERPSAGEEDSNVEDEDSGLSLEDSSQGSQQEKAQSSGFELASTGQLLSAELKNLRLQHQRIEVVAEIFNEAQKTNVMRADIGGRFAVNVVSNPEDEDSNLPLQDRLQISQGKAQCSGIGLASVDKLLSEQFKNLRMQQHEIESLVEIVQEAPHPSVVRDDVGRLAVDEVSNPEVCKELPSGHDAINGNDNLEPRDSHRESKVKAIIKRLEGSEAMSSVSGTDGVEQEKQSVVSEEIPAQERTEDVSEDLQSGSSVDVATLFSSVQADLLEQLQNLRLPQEDETSASQNDGEERKRGDEVTTTTASFSHNERSESTDEFVRSSGSVSRAGKESKINDTHGCGSEKEPHSKNQRFRLKARENAIETWETHYTNASIQKQNNKRKSTDMLGHGNDPETGRGHGAAAKGDDLHAAKAGTGTSAVGTPPGRVPPVNAAGQQKKMKTTCPQPFRLRTQERGALKEVEFNKKAEQYIAAKENTQFSVRACEANNNMKKTQKVPTKDSRWPGRTAQQSQLRAAASACAVQNEEEIKKMRSKMIPHSQKMPSFERPFRPHRSTKSPTIPCSPNFQYKTRKAPGASLTTIDD